MNSKQRVHAALRREPVDRVPIFMWFHPETAVRFGELLGIPPGKVGDAMGNDVRQAWVNNNYAMEGIVHERDGDSHTDAWGIRWVKEGAFNQIAHHPLAAATRDELLAYRFPEDHLEELLAQMLPVVEDADTHFIGCDVSPCVFEMYWRLRGMEPAMLDMAGDPDLAFEMLGRCADFALRLSREAIARYPLDWLWAGDDVAAQQSMIVGPATWRRLVKPHLAPIFRAGRESGLWVAFHCCGSLRPIIGDLVEMGLDVLNPIQCNCPGMDPFELKAEFGADLAFMGGVDTQDLLPHGTAEEVYAATARLIEGMTADGGGFILAASHTVPPETPDENVFAMYRAAGVSREEVFDRAADIRRLLRPL
ncbi:MAG: methyltransferase [Anaerolineae bacterium]|nr:methyltransferase [Anaerolineae bacterium]